MPRNPHERPVKPHTLDRRAEANKVVSRPGKVQHLERADRGINPGTKPSR